MRNIQNHWVAVSTWLGPLSSVYRDDHTGDWKSDHRMQSQNSTTELLVHIERFQVH